MVFGNFLDGAEMGDRSVGEGLGVGSDGFADAVHARAEGVDVIRHAFLGKAKRRRVKRRRERRRRKRGSKKRREKTKKKNKK